jgi:hypothetical protein
VEKLTIVLVILVALVAGGLVGAVLIENSRSVVREHILDSNLATADLAAQFAVNYVEGAETNVRQFATRPSFRSAVWRTTSNKPNGTSRSCSNAIRSVTVFPSTMQKESAGQAG